MTNPEKTFPLSSLLVTSFFPAALLLLVCLVTYLPSIFNGFKLDDFTYLNPDMHQKTTSFWGLFTESTNQHYNPFNIFFNDLFFSWWGKNVVPYHLLNLSLFYFNVLLLYRSCFLITSKKFTALLAAILFCIHPINAEIVNQIVFNTVLIAAAFVQLSFLAFDRYLQTQSKRYFFLSFSYAVVSFLTLETSWLLPAYLLMWAMRDRSFKQALRLTLPYWAITIFLLVIWYQLSQGNTVTGGFVQKFAYLNLSFLTLTGSWAYLFFWYLQKLFIPIDHIWIYSVAPLTVSEAVKYWALTAAAVSAVIFFRKILFARHVLTAAIWFLSGFVFLLPGSLTHPDTGLVIEPYWFYLNSMGFFILAATLFSWLRDNCSRPVVYASLFLICSGSFVYAQKMNQVARTEKSYSEYWMRISPNPVPLTALAKIAYMQKDLPKALEYYELYLQKFSPSPYSAYQVDDLYASIGGLYMQMGQPVKAKELILRSLKSNQNNARAHRLLASVYVNEQDYARAETELIETIKLDDNNLLDKVNLADLYLITKQDKKAIPVLTELTTSKVKGNDRRNVFAKLAVLNFIYNGSEASQETVAQLISIDPDPLSFVVLAQAFAAYQKNEQAVMVLQQGLQKYPAVIEFENMIAQMRPPSPEK